MAAAEARAVWQRTINRYFVQEDAKRAPKLACCQSSSVTSKQVDAGPTTTAHEGDHPDIGFLPSNGKPLFSDLCDDTRWWLHLQPIRGFQKDEEDHKDFDGKKREMEAEDSGEAKDMKDIDMGGSYACMQIDDFGSSVSKQLIELGFEPDSPWISNANNDPWWRAMDKGEVAFLVARKLLDHVENCDLPPPQKLHVKQCAYSKIRCFNHDNPSHMKAQPVTLSTPPVWSHDFDPDETVGTCVASLEEYVPGELHSKTTDNAGPEDMKEAYEVPDGDPCKSQLLEALRHSQTRAREAEKAAKRAHEEKEHIIELFFRQASQLFACQQWFHQWQLKAFYLQAENTDQPIVTPVPAIHPWMPRKGIIVRSKPPKNANTKRGKQGPMWLDITKYALTVALGLSLVGTGLLVGWTVGLLLPPF
ncbi:uncharacterized protein LOC115748551 isoform X2 [Rhodamnia argentea]|uniref:Uncharacterized protein LOC115748551 isoform X2 n=1 Tax=Rhodamnia argentea TaxID=178133 RepID=A0A8B8Q321_9MYRT|nr:uncharacterized protein LOC115748551 isoform X2 [Rhodamnia argentea]